VGWGIPLLLTDTMGPEAQLTLTGVLMGVVLVPLTIPWGYVFRQFVTAPGDRWRKQVTVRPPTQPASAPYEAATISGA
jgi:peptidoglycan/LPS O-acetylase OafA/YrhL